MDHRPLSRALQFIHRLAALPTAGERTDRQLLESFVEQGDQHSFAEVVRRHGPLVWGVCRRVLQNDHDAEDAFQATFLILSRKASAISWHESVKHWLYEAAYRVALRGRASRDRRRARELPLIVANSPVPSLPASSRPAAGASPAIAASAGPGGQAGVAYGAPSRNGHATPDSYLAESLAAVDWFDTLDGTDTGYLASGRR